MDEQNTSPKLQVLLQEADHVQEAISRSIGQAYTIFGIIIPGVFGAALLLTDKANKVVPIEYLSVALVGLVSLSLLFSATLWMEAYDYVRYKYSVLLPRMYELSDIHGEENFLQHVAANRKPEGWIPVILFQVVMLVLAGGLGSAGIMLGTELFSGKQLTLLAISGTLLVFSLVGMGATWRAAARTSKAITDSAKPS